MDLIKEIEMGRMSFKGKRFVWLVVFAISNSPCRHLYQEVSWEAAVILSMIREGTHRRGEVAGGSEMLTTHADEAGDQPTPGDQRSVFPRCVEGLSFFKIITPPLSANGESLKLIFSIYLQS